MKLDKRTIGLGLAAAGAVAAAISVTVFGHKSDTSPQRREVSAYIADVNAIQNRMQVPLSRVMQAYRDFTGTNVAPAERNVNAELKGAASTMDKLSRQLRALPAPAQARQLERRLLALVSAQAAMTHEVERLAVFSPHFARLLQVANRANAALGAALRSVPVPKAHRVRGSKAQVLAAQREYRAQVTAASGAQADALDAYVAALGVVVAHIRALQPPRVLEPSYRAQIQSFKAVRAAGGRLAAELRKATRTDLAQLGRRFVAASRIAQSTAAQRAQIAAITRYNARARAISRAAGDVQIELARLQRSLP